MWTHFMDMHSGGGQKLDWPHIFIEAPEEWGGWWARIETPNA